MDTGWGTVRLDSSRKVCGEAAADQELAEADPKPQGLRATLRRLPLLLYRAPEGDGRAAGRPGHHWANRPGATEDTRQTQ